MKRIFLLMAVVAISLSSFGRVICDTACHAPEDEFRNYVVVMQHVSKEKIDMFIADLIEEQTENIPSAPASSQKSTEKIVRDGQLLIRQNDQTYNANGMKVK